MTASTPFDAGNMLFDLERLRKVHVAHKHGTVRGCLVELLLRHDFNGLGGLGAFRQVVDHVVVDADERDERGADQHDDHEGRHDQASLADDSARELLHADLLEHAAPLPTAQRARESAPKPSRAQVPPRESLQSEYNALPHKDCSQR